MSRHHAITLVDVSARDGLQNEPNAKTLSVETKLAFLRLLAETGLTRIEAGSFVRPQAVPAMANSGEVAELIGPIEADFPEVMFSYLVPNLKGLDRAKSVDAKEIAIFLALSEAFSKANINQSVDESFSAIRPTIDEALASGMRVRGYLSNVFGYTDLPFSADTVALRSKQLLEMGCFEISLGDTTGIGTPDMVDALIDALAANHIPLEPIAMHFHDTFGSAIANVERSYQRGIRTFDAAADGLGGCPYANSPRGNVAMEALVGWCAAHGYSCAIDDIKKLAKATAYIRAALQNESV